ncbi:MAG: bifunctional diaminohydroxyphosphoribosylaminopyrimidine deaminase/5-amino-6-(5-phosphoribosylamino)uracil reductase RibD [Planctomycetaceae bacterium]|jgi:diaminohydroxyphosphoribosylaminopyrimidine deaminase/5-amino-6-(5-phosphoribosylamino)uracil reductase|nr:bifunctional diaminohydroxyphosphoribosylaminopyrimidine deaminase/5-amino-6-(5-phosphoribosylamino)uracil reductase RibD [Planctomycetaceae bacterium]
MDRDMDKDLCFMRRALELAKRGEGFVEPNPMVGCVLIQNGTIIGEGFHRKFGEAHAEVEAIRDASNRFGQQSIVGATCYVTLEPCSHYGKTPPCVLAIQSSGIRRLVVAMRDPNPVVNGQGLKILRDSGIEITEPILEDDARHLNAPYLTLLKKHRPWIIAKWAMTLDGRLASRNGNSQWISGEASRKMVHQLRSRMDAIMIGSRTARLDDPALTVRLDGDTVIPRTPIRIILDSHALLPLNSQLVRTAHAVPVLIVVDSSAPSERLNLLREAGCEILPIFSNNSEPNHYHRTEILMKSLADRKITNLLVEGGSRLFGTLFDMRFIDEVHVFIAPKLIGGETACPVVGGLGIPEMNAARKLESPKIQIMEQDIYIHGRIRYSD